MKSIVSESTLVFFMCEINFVLWFLAEKLKSVIYGKHYQFNLFIKFYMYDQVSSVFDVTVVTKLLSS